MCDKELLVSYVYDELEGGERKAFQHHLASCLACREEVQGLRATRGHLVAWSPPDAALDLRISGAAPSRARRVWMSAGWGLPAAAALVLAAAATMAPVEITTAHGGVTIRTAGARMVQPADDGTREALAVLQQRLRDLEGALASARAAEPEAAPPAALAPASGASGAAAIREAELLRRVRQLIDESENRQHQQFAGRLVQVVRQMQAEHSLDLIRLEQALNQHQGAWSDELFRQREEMKQFYRLVNQR